MAALPRISEPPTGGWLYLVALGSNRRHYAHGAPEAVLKAALAVLAGATAGVDVVAMAPVLPSAPLGPSWRRYANSAALIRTMLAPDALLGVLKGIEGDFGRRRGRRWAARVIDLDIALWQGGRWRSPGLQVPHVELLSRDCVLKPACALVPSWRHPIKNLTMAQARGRLTKPRHAPR